MSQDTEEKVEDAVKENACFGGYYPIQKQKAVGRMDGYINDFLYYVIYCIVLLDLCCLNQNTTQNTTHCWECNKTARA